MCWDTINSLAVCFCCLLIVSERGMNDIFFERDRTRSTCFSDHLYLPQTAGTAVTVQATVRCVPLPPVREVRRARGHV